MKEIFIVEADGTLIHTTEYKEITFRLDYLAKTKDFGLLTDSTGRGKTTAIRNWGIGTKISCLSDSF